MKESYGDRVSSTLIVWSIRGLQIFQAAAVIAGLIYWSGWPVWICSILAAVTMFILRPGIITTVLGMVGAHYGWGFSWIASFLIFFAPAVVLFSLAGGSMLIGRLAAKR